MDIIEPENLGISKCGHKYCKDCLEKQNWNNKQTNEEANKKTSKMSQKANSKTQKAITKEPQTMNHKTEMKTKETENSH